MYEGKWTALTVRQTFFDYFAERGHTIGTIQIQWSCLCVGPWPSTSAQSLLAYHQANHHMEQLIN